MQEEASTASTVGFAEGFSRKYQYIMDKSSPHVLYRWIVFMAVFILYVTRVYFLNGWFIVSYGLGIYMLNQLIGFLSPQVRTVATDLKSNYYLHLNFFPFLLVLSFYTV